MRKILFVDETSEIGGAEVNIISLVPQLHSKNWKPHIILPRKGRLSDRLESLQIDVDFLTIPPLLSSSIYFRENHKIPNLVAPIFNLFSGIIWIIRLVKYYNNIEPDIVHTISMWAHIFGGVAARIAGKPIIWHFQSIVSLDAGFGTYRKFILLLARIIPDRIICVSNLVADQFIMDKKIQKKVCILWNAIDVDRYGEVPVSNDKRIFTIGTIARFTPWKGQHVALAAARELKQRGFQFRWLFAGEETLGSHSYYARLQEQVKMWKLAPEVEMVGWISDMPSFYRSIDALVHSPIEPEPFGLVLAEALAAGLPVISTAGSGIDRLVTAAGGRLVPAKQSHPIALAVEELIKHRNELGSRRTQARQVAQEEFGLDNYTRQLAGIYQSLVEGF